MPFNLSAQNTNDMAYLNITKHVDIKLMMMIMSFIKLTTTLSIRYCVESADEIEYCLNM